MIHADLENELKQDKRTKFASEIAGKTGIDYSTVDNFISVMNEHRLYMCTYEMGLKEFIEKLVSKEMAKFYPLKRMASVNSLVQEVPQKLFVGGYVKMKDWETKPKIVPTKNCDERLFELY